MKQIKQCMFPGCCGATVIGGFDGTDSSQPYPTIGPHATFATLVEGNKHSKHQQEYIDALLAQGWWKVMRWPGEHLKEIGHTYTVCLMVQGPNIQPIEPPMRTAAN